MQFVTGFSISQLEEAFKLISMNNTLKIKQGERMLLSFQGDQNYFTLIINYISDNKHTSDNRLRAILQLKQFMKSQLATSLLDRQSIVSFSYIFQLYLNSQYKLSKYLKEIMVENFSFHGDILFKHLFETNYENDEKKSRMFKFMRSWLSNEFGLDFMWDNSIDILKFLTQEIKSAISNNSVDILKYQIMKLFHFILQQSEDLDEMIPKDIIHNLTQLTVYFLNVPDPEKDQKYAMKLKISSMNCLLYIFLVSFDQKDMIRICQFSGDIWTRYINKPKYTVYCLEYLRTLSQLKVYNILFKDQQILNQAIQRVFALVLGFIYNESNFLTRLNEDSQDFVSTCFMNNQYDPIRLEAQNTVKSLAFNYPKTWLQTVKTGINNPPISNQLICFVVDSYGFYQTQTKQLIQKMSMQIYNKSIRDHFFELYDKVINPQTRFSQKQLLNFVVQMRLINTYINKFQTSQLKIIAILCSKLSAVSELVAPVCYNFINYLFKKSKTHIKFQTNDLVDIYLNILQSMVKNSSNIGNRDIFLIQTGLRVIQDKQTYRDKLKQPLKNILSFLIQRLNQSKEYDMMDITFSVMSYYMDNIGYEPLFESVILFWIKENLFTEYLVRCYVKYLKDFCQNKNNAQSLFLDMSKTDFWLQNKSNGKLNASLYCFLVKLLPDGSEYKMQVIPNMINIIQKLLDNISQMHYEDIIQVHLIAQGIFTELSDLIVQVKKQNQFFNLLLDTNNYIFNKAKDITLMKMIQKALPTNPQTLRKLGNYLLSSRKLKISDNNIQSFNKLLFIVAKFMITQQNLNTTQKLRLCGLWSNLIRCLMDYVSKNNKPNRQTIRKQFSDNITLFIKDTKINIPSLFKQKLQIKLSGLITTSFT